MIEAIVAIAIYIFILISSTAIGLTIIWLEYKFGIVTVSEGISWLKQKIRGKK